MVLVFVISRKCAARRYLEISIAVHLLDEDFLILTLRLHSNGHLDWDRSVRYKDHRNRALGLASYKCVHNYVSCFPFIADVPKVNSA